MANGQVLTKIGFSVMMERAYDSTPSYNQISQFKIGTGSTTPTTSDTILDSMISSWTYPLGYEQKNCASVGFLIAQQKAVIASLVAPKEANGNTITELGLTHCYEMSCPDDICARIVFTGVAKTIDNQLYVVLYFERG